MEKVYDLFKEGKYDEMNSELKKIKITYHEVIYYLIWYVEDLSIVDSLLQVMGDSEIIEMLDEHKDENKKIYDHICSTHERLYLIHKVKSSLDELEYVIGRMDLDDLRTFSHITDKYK